MILISLLIVLALERVVVKSSHWHIMWHSAWLRNEALRQGWIKDETPALQVWLLLLLPALLLAMIEYYLLGPFLTLVEQTLVLFICVGCPALRQTYKCFLQAADRGDLEACSLYTEQLGHCNSVISEEGTAIAQGRSFGQHLSWLNYQHYAAVILWFIGFGAPGALFYTLVRTTFNAFSEDNHPQTDNVYRLLYALDFIPVRITAFGLLMMGHFSRALPEWLKLVGTTSLTPYCVLTRVSAKAEMLTPEELQAQQSNASVEPRILVKLAKRNILFLLSVTAALTLTGLLA
ncbi:beta-lactamase regulator AmpE [Alteromonas sp. CYL-A6]|uniref:beta-lactamase regulator AmpE n=1 Tax=Alteromonas nitratireducens TaxID=3390813 RepID=UPI0034AA8316